MKEFNISDKIQVKEGEEKKKSNERMKPWKNEVNFL